MYSIRPWVQHEDRMRRKQERTNKLLLEDGVQNGEETEGLQEEGVEDEWVREKGGVKVEQTRQDSSISQNQSEEEEANEDSTGQERKNKLDYDAVQRRSPLFLCPDGFQDCDMVRTKKQYDYIHVPFINNRQPEFLKSVLVQSYNPIKSDDTKTHNEQKLDFDLTGIYVVPPQHYFQSDSKKRIDTEPRVRAALDECILRWRTGNYPTAEKREDEEVWVGTNRTRDGQLLLYAWRPSPTLNWKLKGRKASLDYFSTYARLRGEDNDGLVNLDGGDSIKVPFNNIVAYPTMRLEIIMIVYRYVSIVINRVVSSFELPDLGGGVTQHHKNYREEVETLKEIKSTLIETISTISDCSCLMSTIVSPLLSGWTTLASPPPIAELTQECCVMFRHLLTAIRLIYSARLQKIHYYLEMIIQDKRRHKIYSNETFFERLYAQGNHFPANDASLMALKMKDFIKIGDVIPELEPVEQTDEQNAYGIKSREWAKLDMAISLSLLEVLEIYDNYIDYVYGSKQRPEYIVLRSFRPQRSRFAEYFRNYVLENFILYFCRSLGFHLLSLDHEFETLQLDEHDLGAKEGVKCGTAVTQMSMRRIKEQILCICQVGLITCRPLLISQNENIHHAQTLEKRFENTFHKYFPALTDRDLLGTNVYDSDSETDLLDESFNFDTDEEGNQVASQVAFVSKRDVQGQTSGAREPGLLPHQRIADKRGLKGFMEKISHLCERHNCNYLIDHIPLATQEKRHFYPSKTTIALTPGFLRGQTIGIDLTRPMTSSESKRSPLPGADDWSAYVKNAL